jgi:hypothetical protein
VKEDEESDGSRSGKDSKLQMQVWHHTAVKLGKKS